MARIFYVETPRSLRYAFSVLHPRELV